MRELTSTPYRHWAHGGGIWCAGEPQVVLGDVLARSNDGAVLPAEALLRPVGQVQGIDGEDQGLGAKLLLEARRAVLLLGFPVGIVEVHPGGAAFPLLSHGRVGIIHAPVTKKKEHLLLACQYKTSFVLVHALFSVESQTLKVNTVVRMFLL